MEPSPEAAADRARARMLERLRDRGISETTLRAFAAVPRHDLVPRFWSLDEADTPGAAPAEHRADTGEPASLDLLFDIDRAVAVNQVAGARGGTTSTASAPLVLAMQADALDLRPGMSVLEVGTGPGYFAAVLAELVGEAGRVVSIDIDADVVDKARARLDACGYGRIEVLCRDGDDGAAEHAPFDRVIASVGCADVAASWLRQLRPDGFALVPLQHGCFHPVLRVDGTGHGRLVMHSGYVAIRGRQGQVSPWPHAHAAVATDAHLPLADAIAEALRAGDRTTRYTSPEWDLGLWVALNDARAGVLASLNDGAGASAIIDRAHRRVAYGGGEAGGALAIDLLDHANAWLDAGAPTSEQFAHRLVPLGTEASQRGRWVIARSDHAQHVTL
jgi:protein-L-isoaspartate(D-aspartate) O-methyltransferase